MRTCGQTAFSVVIPAHNEEQYIGKCLAAVCAAAEAVYPCRTEISVVANRCTDKTAEIAEKYGQGVIDLTNRQNWYLRWKGQIGY